MPISVDIDAHSIHLLQFDLREASAEIKTRVADVMQTSGPTFVNAAKQRVPVDTGALQRSIDFTVLRREPRLRVGPMRRIKNPKSGKLAISYAGYVHDGTSRMPPRPFVWDAVKAHTTDQGRFMRGLREAGVSNIGRSTGGL